MPVYLMSEENCGNDIMVKAIAYSESRGFEDRIYEFKEEHKKAFKDQISNQQIGKGEEQVKILNSKFKVTATTAAITFLHDHNLLPFTIVEP